jgi:hypothetical protein
VSTSSQRGRLEAILTEHGVLAAGRIRTGVDHDLPLEARREVSATVEYLVQTHGPDPLRAWFEDRLVWADSMGTGGTGGRTREPVSTARRITEAMGIAYIAPRNAVDIQSFNTWTTAMTEGVPVSGYDHVFVVDGIPGPAIQVGGREVKLEYEVETLSLRLDAGAGPLIRIPLAGAIERARARSPKVAADPISNPPIRVDNDRVALQLVIRNLSGYEGAEGPLLTGFNALVFLRFKE